jgi:hypothetical protein
MRADAPSGPPTHPLARQRPITSDHVRPTSLSGQTRPYPRFRTIQPYRQGERERRRRARHGGRRAHSRLMAASAYTAAATTITSAFAHGQRPSSTDERHRSETAALDLPRSTARFPTQGCPRSIERGMKMGRRTDTKMSSAGVALYPYLLCIVASCVGSLGPQFVLYR